MEDVNAAVLVRVPRQLVVVPVLLDPQVRRHDLVPQVLQSINQSFKKLVQLFRYRIRSDSSLLSIGSKDFRLDFQSQ